MAVIFLSHSHADSELAKELAKQIRIEFGLRKKDIFASSEADAITIGSNWLETVLDALNSSEVIIPLITPSSSKSMWVSFEYGYLWGIKGKNTILPLYHPKAKATIPSPLNTIESKRVDDDGDLKEFFKQLATTIKSKRKYKANLMRVVQTAVKIPTLTGEDYQLQLTCKLHLITTTDIDAKNNILRWMRDRDILHDADLAWIKDLRKADFVSANMQRINLGGNDLSNANFTGANLENAIFGSTTLRGADFTKANIYGADFAEAKLEGAIFREIAPGTEVILPNGKVSGFRELSQFEAIIQD